MEKGLARFRVSLLCFVAAGLLLLCCCCFVAAGLLQLVCCGCFVATGLLQLVCCAEVADSRRRSFPLRGSLPFSGANASCGCLPPQRCRYSNRVLVQCPVGLSMPPATVCHLSAAGTPTASWSRDHAHKYSRGILAWRRGHLSTLWHGDPAYKGLSAIPACQSISQPTSNRSHPSIPPVPRHGDPTHNALSATPACQSGHLSTLWHGDPQQNHFWGRVTWQDCLEPVSNRSLADASAGLRHGIPGERPLGGILAWRSSHLLALRP